MFYFTLELSSS